MKLPTQGKYPTENRIASGSNPNEKETPGSNYTDRIAEFEKKVQRDRKGRTDVYVKNLHDDGWRAMTPNYKKVVEVYMRRVEDIPFEEFLLSTILYTTAKSNPDFPSVRNVFPCISIGTPTNSQFSTRVDMDPYIHADFFSSLGDVLRYRIREHYKTREIDVLVDSAPDTFSNHLWRLWTCRFRYFLPEVFLIVDPKK